MTTHPPVVCRVFVASVRRSFAGVRNARTHPATDGWTDFTPIPFLRPFQSYYHKTRLKRGTPRLRDPANTQ